MNYQRKIALLALCAVLAACDMPDTTMANGGITLRDNVVTLHADGAPDAILDSSGNLHIDGKPVTVTPVQHGLLMLYFQSVADVHQTGAEMGKVGAGMGAKALKNSFDGKSKTEQQQDAQAGGNQLKTLGLKICQDQVNLKNVQDQLVAQLPAFKPYGGIVVGKSAADCAKDDN